MDSFLDDVDSLIAPGLSTDTPEWCGNCQSLRQEIKRLQDEQLQNFGKLKQKIISTDLLIKKYKSKCDDHDLQYKRSEEANKRADKFQSQGEILETQLKAALLDTEPLRKTKVALEAELRMKNAELQTMSDRLLAAEGSQRQYEYLTKVSSGEIDKLEIEKKELMSKVKMMESGKISKEAAKEYKHQISGLKRDNISMVKNEKRLDKKLSAALAKIEHLTNVIKERKYSPIRRRRTNSGTRQSPLKSPGRSPREQKLSPAGRGRARTTSERSSALVLQNKDVAIVPVGKKLALATESSSDDSDESDSMSSVSWTFSPIMKCLSPLPPSPACFANRKPGEPLQAVCLEDEDEVSDIADELEQQLLQEGGEEHETTFTSVYNAPEEMKTDSLDIIKNTSDINGDMLSERHTVDIHIIEETNNNQIDDQNKQGTSETKSFKLDEKQIERDKDDLVKCNEVKQFSSPEYKEEKELTVKEQLAYCIAILSPTALRKRNAHVPSQNKSPARNIRETDIEKTETEVKMTEAYKDVIGIGENVLDLCPEKNILSTEIKRTEIEVKRAESGNDVTEVSPKSRNKKGRIPPIRRSTRIQSRKDSETSESESDGSESKMNEEEITNHCHRRSDESDVCKEVANSNRNYETMSESQELSRNNTEEFVPGLTEQTETLTDSEMEVQLECAKTNLTELEQDTAAKATESSVSSQNTEICEKTGREISNTHKDGIDVHISDEIACEDHGKHIEIWKENETAEVCRTPMPHETCLCKQEVATINDTPTKLYKDIAALKCTSIDQNSKKQKRKTFKFGPGNFINFQKSSAETLSNEIEDFSYVNDYQVVSRDDKDSTIMSPKVELRQSVRKNLKQSVRKMRKNCMYIDHDSQVNPDNSTQMSDVYYSVDRDSESKLFDKALSKKSDVRRCKGKRDIEIGVSSKIANRNADTEQCEIRIGQPEVKSTDLNINDTLDEDGISTRTTTKLLSLELETVYNKHGLRCERKSDCDQSESNSKNIISKTDKIVKDSSENKNIAKLDSDTVANSKEPKDVIKNETKSDVQNALEKVQNQKISDIKQLELKSETDVEKVIPSRQLSTGFTVNTPTVERTFSTDSGISFSNSPSRLFNLDSGNCDTILEEADGEEVDIDAKDNVENNKDKVKGDHNSCGDSNFIFGVEDLLDIGTTESQFNQKDIQNSAQPFCDKTAHADKYIDTRTSDKTPSKLTTLSVSKAIVSDKYNRPGCSYHSLQTLEQTNQSLSREVARINAAETGAPINNKSSLLSDQDDCSMSRSSTPSIVSIDRTSPVSPLSISPFEFWNPISPLPPSPVREIERDLPEQLTVEQMELDKENPKTYENVESNKHETIKEEKDWSKQQEEIDNNELVAQNDKDVPNEVISAKGEQGTELCCKREDFKNENVENKSAEIPLDISIGISKAIQPKDGLMHVHKLPYTAKSACIKVHKLPDMPISAHLKIESLEMVPLPHLISPVKSPKNKSSVKLKSKQTKKEIHTDDNIETSVLKLQSIYIKEPKQFVTKAPKSAIEVKPKVTRSCVSLMNSEVDICVRKSSRNTIKRVAPVETQSRAIKMLSIDESRSKSGPEVDQSVITSRMDNTVSEKTKIAMKQESVRDVNCEGPMDNEDTVNDKGDHKVPTLKELPAGLDNLAFKRKTRVAHKAHVHPLKPHKIQMIDAPMLPPVTAGRKRKTLDNTKETKDKKQCKENKFEKQKPAAIERSISKENTRKMQAFLKSSESAESFVSKAITDLNKDGLGLDLLNICLECLGRVRTDTLEVVYRNCESGEYLNLATDNPFLSDVEKQAVPLMQHLLTHMKTGYTIVMKTIWQCVFSRELEANIVGKMAQCRLFTALCSIQGDLELARALFYQLFTCGFMNATPFVVPVISVWPEVLMKDPSDQPDKVVSHGMILVLEEVLTKSLLTRESEANKKILVILQKLCHFSGTSGNADTIIKVLLTRLMAATDDDSEDKSAECELIKSLELLFTGHNWAWFKEQFINRHGLQTASNKYTAGKITKPVPPDYVCAVLRLTSYGISKLAGSVKLRDYQMITRHWLLPILLLKPGVEKVRYCCLETMLEISPFFPDVMQHVHKWFSTEKDTISQEFTARLENLRLQYKQKFAIVCKPFYKT